MNRCKGRDNYICSNPATFFVTFFPDGDGGRETCGLHLAVAVQTVAKNCAASWSNPTILVRELT